MFWLALVIPNDSNSKLQKVASRLAKKQKGKKKNPHPQSSKNGFPPSQQEGATSPFYEG